MKSSFRSTNEGLFMAGASLSLTRSHMNRHSALISSFFSAALLTAIPGTSAESQQVTAKVCLIDLAWVEPAVLDSVRVRIPPAPTQQQQQQQQQNPSGQQQWQQQLQQQVESSRRRTSDAVVPAVAPVAREGCIELPEDLLRPSLVPYFANSSVFGIRFFQGATRITLRDAGLSRVTVAVGDSTIRLSLPNLDRRELQFEATGPLLMAGHEQLGLVRVVFNKTAGVLDSLDGWARKSTQPIMKVCAEHLCAASGRLLTVGDGPQTPSASPEDVLFVEFSSGIFPFTPVEADLRKVSFVVNNNVAGALAFNELRVSDNSAIVPLAKLANYPQSTVVSLDVEFGEGMTERRTFRLRKKSETYGSNGIWMPIGLFSTNFKSATDTAGIPFAASPIGFALGKRWYDGVEPNAYHGVSLVASWVILPKSEGDEDASGYNLQAMTVGGIYDFRDYAYVGGALVASGGNKPRYVLLVGPGPTLLSTFKMLGNRK